MAYMFLSFTDKMDKGSNSWSDVYSTSLVEQFDQIQKRIPLDRQVNSLLNFIEACFPSGLEKKYYFSCPNFLRERRQSSFDRPSFLDNIIIRPEYTISMKRVLPDNQTIILIGDICEGEKVKVFQVKGIQLIDLGMESPHDKVITATACSAYSKSQSVNRAGQVVKYEVWSVGEARMENSLFTPNFVYDLIQTCWTVKNPEIVRQTYEKWNKYINFRNYYLLEQSKRNFKLERATFLNSYAVNRKEYRKNASIYDDYLLDGRQEFSYGDMIVLSEKVEDAEEFPLIRLDIERNRKKFNEAKIIKRGKPISEEEKKIRSLSSDNVFITMLNPQGESKFKDKNGNSMPVTFGELINDGYALGDKFKIVSYEIEPIAYLNELDDEHNKSIDKSYRIIDAKYEKIINNEFDSNVLSFSQELQNTIDKQINEKEEALSSSLDEEVRQNSDGKIIDVINRKKKEIENNIRKIYKQEKNERNNDYEHRTASLKEKEFEKIDIKTLYIERNKFILNDFAKKLDIEKNRLLS